MFKPQYKYRSDYWRVKQALSGEKDGKLLIAVHGSIYILVYWYIYMYIYVPYVHNTEVHRRYYGPL